MKRISLEDIFIKHPDMTYAETYSLIRRQLDDGLLRPVKASGTNGKKPALYREYWIVEEPEDRSDLEEELKYGLHPLISIDHYFSHLETYVQDRVWVRMLSDYLKQGRASLDHRESVNERSFEIWNQEKFLTKGPGKKILKRCGLDLDLLNIYETGEPLAYYSYTRKTPQDLLILENKDTFYSMRQHMLGGDSKILGMDVGTLIYGGGKRILRSFQDFDICVEPYMRERDNRIYYFGDLDHEGIGIYENLAGMFEGRWDIRPFCRAYEKMLEKAQRVAQLPQTKERQNRNIAGVFFSYFEDTVQRQMLEILERGVYIPQEIVNISDLSEGGCGYG